MNKMQKKKLNRTQRTLFVLLPVLVLSLAALLFLSQRMQHAAGDAPQAGADSAAGSMEPADESPAQAAGGHSDTTGSAGGSGTQIPDSQAQDSQTQDSQAQDSQTQDSQVQDSQTQDSQAQDSQTQDSQTPDDSREPVTLLFTGDVMLSSYVLNNYNSSGIGGVLSPQLLNELKNADITVINNEFPFSTRGEQAPDKQFTFRVDPGYVSVLTDMGVDIAGLANNHVLDYGSDALLDTFDTLDGAGIDYMGAGTSMARASALITKEINGKTFGFLAASRVIPVVSWDIQNASPGVFTTYDPARLVAAISSARESCDYLTVFVHWGIERDEYPQDYQVTMAQQYIDAGADLVIGAHPHVLQGITYYKDKPVFYSLGNFIFNQEISRTAAVKVTVPDEGEPAIQVIAASASGARTSASDGDKKAATYDYLESISEGIAIDGTGILTQKKE